MYHFRENGFDFDVFFSLAGKTSPVCYIIPSLATILYTFHAISSDCDLGFSEKRSNRLCLPCEGVFTREKKKLLNMSLKRGWFMRLVLALSSVFSLSQLCSTCWQVLACSLSMSTRLRFLDKKNLIA